MAATGCGFPGLRRGSRISRLRHFNAGCGLAEQELVSSWAFGCRRRGFAAPRFRRQAGLFVLLPSHRRLGCRLSAAGLVWFRASVLQSLASSFLTSHTLRRGFPRTSSGGPTMVGTGHRRTGIAFRYPVGHDGLAGALRSCLRSCWPGSIPAGELRRSQFLGCTGRCFVSQELFRSTARRPHLQVLDAAVEIRRVYRCGGDRACRLRHDGRWTGGRLRSPDPQTPRQVVYVALLTRTAR